jgi:tetratricopeptide (TPR) repeat protein
MHPTIFELRSFGLPTLPAAQGRAILRHLRGGCGRCRAALAPRLIPWMDDGPADEARATDPARCGRTIEAVYLRAAGRALKAAARHRSTTEGNREVGQALTILNAEGPEAIGRLPRRLLGLPAIEALLYQTRTLGLRDPRLRLRLAELAYDLTTTVRGDQCQMRRAHCRAAIELANAQRVALDLSAAQRELDRAEEDLAGDRSERLLHARLLTVQASIDTDLSQPTAARRAIAAAILIYRQEAQRAELAKALITASLVSSDNLGDYEESLDSCRQALSLLDPEDDPWLAATALQSMCFSLLRSGRWPEAFETLRLCHRLRGIPDGGRNHARLARLEGEILGHAGDLAGATRAFDVARQQLLTIGHRYEAGVVTLSWAATLRLRGDMEAADRLIADATESMLGLDPHREVYLGLLYLRTANRFSALRSSLPLQPVIEFLQHAEFNPSIRLQSYLA